MEVLRRTASAKNETVADSRNAPSIADTRSRDIRNYVATTSSGLSSGYVTMTVIVVLVTVCCTLPQTQAASSYIDPDYSYATVEGRSAEDDPELLQKVLMLSRLLRGRQLGVASGLFMPVQRALDNPEVVATRKRGPTSCINNCLTGGMSFVRCKSMCHW